MTRGESRITGLALALLLLGCGGGGPSEPPPYDGPLTIPYEGEVPDTGGGNGDSPIQHWRDLWTRAGITDYRMSVSRLVPSIPEGEPAYVIVEVRGGEVVSRTWSNTGQPVTAIQGPEFYGPDVEALFEMIEDAYARNFYTIDVTWDPYDGHPITIHLLRTYWQDGWLVEEEDGVTVLDLKPL